MVPPALNGDQQAESKAAVQELPAQAGSDLSKLISAAVQMWIPHWLQFGPVIDESAVNGGFPLTQVLYSRFDLFLRPTAWSTAGR